MHQLGGQDASFLSTETLNTPNHVAGIYIYDQSSAPGGLVTFMGILAISKNRLQLARSFRERAVRVPLDFDHPYWIEDESFDLEFHVRHIALPRPHPHGRLLRHGTDRPRHGSDQHHQQLQRLVYLHFYGLPGNDACPGFLCRVVRGLFQRPVQRDRLSALDRNFDHVFGPLHAAA
jgi:Wax ester synthase-like Acyl-CoA acyltransferase domain